MKQEFWMEITEAAKSRLALLIAGSPETGKPKRLIEFSCSEMLIQTAFNWVFPML